MNMMKNLLKISKLISLLYCTTFSGKTDTYYSIMESDKYYLNQISQDNKEAFTFLFRKYYKDLVMFGGNYLSDKDSCEDIVQNIFLRLWANRKDLFIESSLKSFLLKSVQNACLDEIRHQNSVKTHEAYTLAFNNTDDLDIDNYILYSDLQDKLMKALEKLPKDCRQAFELNRFEGLKYREIASFLNMSERTVEVRIGKALAFLREYLKEFFILLLLLLLC